MARSYEADLYWRLSRTFVGRWHWAIYEISETNPEKLKFTKISCMRKFAVYGFKRWWEPESDLRSERVTDGGGGGGGLVTKSGREGKRGISNFLPRFIYHPSRCAQKRTVPRIPAKMTVVVPSFEINSCLPVQFTHHCCFLSVWCSGLNELFDQERHLFVEESERRSFSRRSTHQQSRALEPSLLRTVFVLHFRRKCAELSCVQKHFTAVANTIIIWHTLPFVCLFGWFFTFSCFERYR